MTRNPGISMQKGVEIEEQKLEFALRSLITPIVLDWQMEDMSIERRSMTEGSRGHAESLVTSLRIANSEMLHRVVGRVLSAVEKTFDKKCYRTKLVDYLNNVLGLSIE
jgi:hypothetical protein